MKTFFVIYCLIVETFLVQSLSDTSLEVSGTKKLDDWNIDDIDLSLEETSPDSHRKRDPGYFYNKPNRFNSNYFPHSRHGHKGRVVTKLQNQVNRPFSQYGPPNHGNVPQNYNRVKPASNILNQEVPVQIRQTEFIEESPIASQNSLPFGQHTANYLPPQNQKLPAFTSPHLFSNQNHDFSSQLKQQHQQQLHLQEQQQQHFNQAQKEQREQQLLLQQQHHYNQVQQQNFNQVQQQHFNQVQQQQQQQQQHQQHFSQSQQETQMQIDDQSSFIQQFSTPSFNQDERGNNNQQISDAALFLSQNAPAISQLYEAPAVNQNYAPYNQEFPQSSQSQIQNQNLHIQTQNVQNEHQFLNQQLPSYSSGVLDTQKSLEDVKSLEKDRLISQLRLELSSRENAARFIENNEDVRGTQNEISLPLVSQFPPRNRPSKHETSFGQLGVFSSPSITVGSSLYRGLYPPPVAAPPTEPPVLATPSPPVSSTFVPSHSSSESGSSQIGTNLSPSDLLKPSITSPYPQYGSFAPTLVSPTNFVPSIPSYGTTLSVATVKPTDNSPTHFGIPIPTLQDERPQGSLPNLPTTSKPTSISLHPGISTISVPLGPVHHFPSHPQILKPNPVPIIPAAAPVHPTYGIHPAVINPGFVYKPVKVYPVYHYPHLGFFSPGRKSVYSTTSTHPWGYAPSYAQAKPIWK